jgi:hypothetical protein
MNKFIQFFKGLDSFQAVVLIILCLAAFNTMILAFHLLLTTGAP